MANEQDSRVTVVHGCFSEGGDSSDVIPGGHGKPFDPS